MHTLWNQYLQLLQRFCLEFSYDSCYETFPILLNDLNTNQGLTQTPLKLSCCLSTQTRNPISLSCARFRPPTNELFLSCLQKFSWAHLAKGFTLRGDNLPSHKSSSLCVGLMYSFLLRSPKNQEEFHGKERAKEKFSDSWKRQWTNVKLQSLFLLLLSEDRPCWLALDHSLSCCSEKKRVSSNSWKNDQLKMLLFLIRRKDSFEWFRRAIWLLTLYVSRIPGEIKFSYMRPKICSKFIF